MWIYSSREEPWLKKQTNNSHLQELSYPRRWDWLELCGVQRGTGALTQALGGIWDLSLLMKDHLDSGCMQHSRIGSVLLLNVKTTISPNLDDHKLTAKNISKLYFVTNRGQEEAEVQRWRVWTQLIMWKQMYSSLFLTRKEVTLYTTIVILNKQNELNSINIFY